MPRLLNIILMLTYAVNNTIYCIESKFLLLHYLFYMRHNKRHNHEQFINHTRSLEQWLGENIFE